MKSTERKKEKKRWKIKSTVSTLATNQTKEPDSESCHIKNLK